MNSENSLFGQSPSSAAPLCAAPLATIIPPVTKLPPNSCDSHLHVLGPAHRHPYAANRIYTPSDCLLPDYRRLFDSLGLARCVFVQPSVYGDDNGALLEALSAMGDAARGVAVIGEQTTSHEIDEMHAKGVRGVRVNVVDVSAPGSGLPVELLLALQERIASNGWHIELLIHVDQHPELYEQLRHFDVPFVFGHMGYESRDADVGNPGFSAMLALMQEGRAWAKLTGPYRLALGGLPFAKAGLIARRLISACPDRLVWGSDWPHVMVKDQMPHASQLLDLAAEWLGGELLETVFSGNPARLYGWDRI